MKRMWIAVLMVTLALPAVALAQKPVAAWCDGAHGPQGTNFGTCPRVERDVQVAGPSSGMRRQTVNMPMSMSSEYPSAVVDRSAEIESP